MTPAPANRGGAGGAGEVCEDIFTAQESAAYLKLPSVRAFNGWRKQAKVRGIRVGNERRYSREQLSYIRQYIFGMVKGGK